MIEKYVHFVEVEKEIRENVPAVVYKFRSWEHNYNKRIIANRKVWFAHPHSLNDPYDVPPPYNFAIVDINLDEARNKIRRAGIYYDHPMSDEQLEKEVNTD
jgi:hypothetical protein